jgi:protein TonB
MIRYSTISAPRIQAERRRAARIAPPRSRFVLIAVLLSVGVHLLAALLIVFLPRVLPPEAGPKEQVTVELLMVEKKGNQASQADQPSVSKPPPMPPEKAETPKPEPPKPEPPKPEPPKAETPKPETPNAAVQKDETPAPVPKPVPAPPVPLHGDEPALPPAEPAPPKPAKAEPQPAPKQAAAQPTPPRTQKGLVLDLDGTDSWSNATVLGGQVLPAQPDDRFRNKPPIYPIEAQVRNEHGSVVVVIHVSADGAATGADIAQSSGVDVLDQAALAAVRKWHFHPAIKEGHAVPSDFTFEFIFESR